MEMTNLVVKFCCVIVHFNIADVLFPFVENWGSFDLLIQWITRGYLMIRVMGLLV